MKTKFIFLFFAILLFSPIIFAASSGAPDSTFGKAGFVRTNVFGDDKAIVTAIQSDGRIVVGGQNSSSDFVIVRYLPNGALDPSFSGDGIQTTSFSAVTDKLNDLCIQPDGKIVAIGLIGTSSSVQLARYNLDGSLDTSFDSDGKVSTSYTSLATKCEVQSDGKILFLLKSFNDGFAVGRLKANGSTDSFGTGGLAFTTVGGISAFTREFKVQADGKIVVVGGHSSGFVSAVVRFNSNGTLDTSFNGSGIATFDLSVGTDFANDFAFQSDGKIILGIQTIGTIIVRLNQNGTIDTTFGTNGKTQLESVDIDNILIQSDEKILVSGDILTNSERRYKSFRLNGNNGNLDPSFGQNGILQIPEATRVGTFFTAALLENKLILSFTQDSQTLGQDFAVKVLNLEKTPILSSDFDGDGATDTAVFRPSGGNWFVLNSSDNSFASFTFGLNGDVPVDGDFDGDGKTDLAVFRPSNGLWSIQKSSDNSVFITAFGNSTDKPVAADFDKDGKSDIAVFRPSTGEWLSLTSASNFTTLSVSNFGQNGDIPIPADTK